MASTKTPAVPKASSVTLTQQAVNLARQIIAAQGWTKPESAITDIYVAGKMLAETLPNTEPLDWIKDTSAIDQMSKAERAAYSAKDKAWVEKPYTFSVAPAERDVVERAFQHFAATAASAKTLGPSPFLLELIVAFNIKDAAPAPAK